MAQQQPRGERTAQKSSAEKTAAIFCDPSRAKTENPMPSSPINMNEGEQEVKENVVSDVPQVDFSISPDLGEPLSPPHHHPADDKKSIEDGSSSVLLAEDETKAAAEAAEMITPFLAQHQDDAKTPSKTRTPHIFKDQDGNVKTFGSALGLLTRRFVDLIHASQSGAVDMNESAIHLQVPKRRIYDITNVLEGVGLIEKRSKNTVAWKGSEAILGSALDQKAKDEMIRLRGQISDLHKEENLIDQWIAQLSKLSLSIHPVYISDIIEGLFYPMDMPQLIPKETLVDETQKPLRTVLAIHSPFESVAHIPKREDGLERHLFVGAKSGLQQFQETEIEGKKRKATVCLQVRKGSKASRTEDKIQVYQVNTAFEETEYKLKAVDAGLISINSDPASSLPQIDDSSLNPVAVMEKPEEGVKRSSSWEVAESLANEEGVADFFGTGETETAV